MARVVPVAPEVLVWIAERQVKGATPEYCGVDNCAREHRAMNLCAAHYLKFWKWRQQNPYVLPEYPFPDIEKYVQPISGRGKTLDGYKCHVPGCLGKHVGRGLCRKHYQYWWNERKQNEGH